MQTNLNLLTRDGLVYMAFTPALTADQYAELLELTKHQSTRAEMLSAVKEWAEREGLKLALEE